MNLTAFDKVAKKDLMKGTVHDLGEERNKIAVEKGIAKWVTEETKNEVAKPIQSEKNEGTPKKTTSSVKGKKIETK